MFDLQEVQRRVRPVARYLRQLQPWARHRLHPPKVMGQRVRRELMPRERVPREQVLQPRRARQQRRRQQRDELKSLPMTRGRNKQINRKS